MNGLKNLFSILRQLQSNDLQKYTQYSDENKSINDIFELNLWKIPHFIELIYLCSYGFEKDERISDIDKVIIENEKGMYLLTKLKDIFKNWAEKINEFLPDIHIKSLKEVGLEGDLSINIEDTILKIYIE